MNPEATRSPGSPAEAARSNEIDSSRLSLYHSPSLFPSIPLLSIYFSILVRTVTDFFDKTREVGRRCKDNPTISESCDALEPIEDVFGR